MQEFYINQGSVNPTLRMELINDGRYDYRKTNIFNNSIQNADITFSMRNIDNGVLKVSKSKAQVIEFDDENCETKYLLQYCWNNRDVKDKGTYKAWFEINFKGDITEEGVEYPKGNLIVPIREELIIHVL